MDPFEKVIRSDFDYYEIRDKPNPVDLSAYYQNKYFQNCDDYKSPPKDYEIKSKKISSRLLLYALSQLNINTSSKFFEIGFGEGFLLDAALDAGHKIRGVDFSVNQIHEINNNIRDYVESSTSPLDHFLSLDDEFPIVCMQHVVEHLINPVDFIENIYLKLKPGSVVAVEVPNDFSCLQKYLVENGHVQSPYWVCPPDHLAYFTEDTLISLFKSVGFLHQHTFGSFPIEIFLLGEESNYNKYPKHGKSAHQARCLFDDFLFDSLGIESVYNLYSSNEMCKISRSITCIFKKP